MTTFKKTPKQFQRILRLVKHADKEGIKIDLSDHRKLNDGRPSKLTPEIEDAMKMINRKNVQNKDQHHTSSHEDSPTKEKYQAFLEHGTPIY